MEVYEREEAFKRLLSSLLFHYHHLNRDVIDIMTIPDEVEKTTAASNATDICNHMIGDLISLIGKLKQVNA